jgi:AraC-like DNA-binding protein
VFVVVNIREGALRSIIAASDSGAETVVLNESGELISRTGAAEIDPDLLSARIKGAKSGSSQIVLQGTDMKLSFVQSDLNHWWYISLNRLRDVLRPTDFVRNISVLTVGILYLLGIAASYLLSRKMYGPIDEIKHGLEASVPHRIDSAAGVRPDEFDRIKLLSSAIIFENREMSQQLSDIKPILDEIRIGKLVSGECNNLDDLESGPDFATRFSGEMLVCCIGIQFFSEIDERLTENEKRLLTVELKNRIVTGFDQRIWVTELYKQQLVCIVGLPDGGHQGGLRATEKLKDILQEYADCLKATVGVGKFVRSVGDLHDSYKEAVRLLDFKSFTPATEVIRDGHITGHYTNEGYLSLEEVNRLMYLSRISDEQGLTDYITELLERRAEADITAKYMLGIGQDILNSLVRVSSENSKDDHVLEKYSVLGGKLRKCVSLEEMCAFFGETRELLLATKSTNDARSEIFEEVVRYVQTHYDEELSLELLAGRYSMSLGYFSRSFKETVGEKYVDYVNKVRIAKAKELLTRTDMKIADIAGAVGYIADRTFTTIFKKYEGITPGKYRIMRRG